MALTGRQVLVQLLEASIARLADRGTWVQWQWNERAACFETVTAFRYADKNSLMLPLAYSVHLTCNCLICSLSVGACSIPS